MAETLKRPGVWGIDLGQCALKAIRLEEEDGQIHATAFDYIEHPKILSQPDADPDQLTREALEKFLSRNDLKGDTVAISVPGQSGLARFVKLPPVDEKKIPDIVKFEAKQQIPFPLHEVVWGFQRLGQGTTSDNMVLDAEIGLFAMKRDMINRAMQQFKDVGIEVHFIQMAPLALCNFMAHDILGKGASGTDEEDAGAEKDCVVGLDIGADNSNLVITDGEKIIWQRPIPLGGNHFTRALTKELKLTFAKAEHLKRNAVKSPDLRKILAALKPVLNDFVSEVQRSLGYFTNTHRDATIRFMLGLGNAFRLPGLQKYLQEKLQLEVRKLQKIERLNGEESVTEAPQYVENVLSFAVAHGLALQGLKSTRIYTNLLPPEIAQERAIRAKKPWAVAAAAVLLLISPPLLFGWSAAVNGWNNKEVADANKSLETVVKEAQSDITSYAAADRDAQDKKNTLLKLAGGVMERLNWVYLNYFINEAMPRPDGSHLVELAKDGSRPYLLYFGNEKTEIGPGLEALKQWKIFRDKLGQGAVLTPEDQRNEEEIKKNLVQINIEGIAALYADTLQADAKTWYLDYANTERPASDKFPPLPNKSWVVEIRGYTYHRDKELFVKNSLVENLITLADPNPKKTQKLKNASKTDAGMDLVLISKDATGGKEKARISHIFMYDSRVDASPRPGVFLKIHKSPLAEKMGVWGNPDYRPPAPIALAPDPTKDGPVGADGAPLPVPKEKVVATRSSWRPPSGTMAGDSFGVNLSTALSGGGSGYSGAAPEVKTPALPPTAFQRAPRTEFVVWFVWNEPITWLP